MIGLLLLLVLAVIAFGVWRRFGAVQWIWTVFGLAIGMLLLWVLLVIFVVGPEMRRTAPLLGS